jgi:hypothetical protein
MSPSKEKNKIKNKKIVNIHRLKTKKSFTKFVKDFFVFASTYCGEQVRTPTQLPM